ncbi:RpiB/LacA/LacB family sugar-phosphate isomerase [Scytonema sp. UIC 10036]|uniref:RpiB/LacA/LacB family sugar-phosphate isomerase n=1 Tax=Scytonema sp. UIC 10036 TaxID=2304196 RepID=UPI0012DAE8D8|nr:RpiB/LacA/LacB family sugar-phosphate isomerase [Scytonema sp. UIC 10036]MUH00319.1 RpiB/LacA/LacB family sugar-phosphate isomerase [Scytonema sp. UIC 10036]
MKIILGADFYGFDLKEVIKEYLLDKGIEVEDMGVSDRTMEIPYYETAALVAQRIGNQQAAWGILVCGTGMGMAIIANKYPGVYAAVCENSNAAEKSRSINNSNVLTLGGLITKPEVAKEIVDTWLTTEFTQGWEPAIQEWLQNSMKDISQLEKQQFERE